MGRHGNAVKRTGRSFRLDDEHWEYLRVRAFNRGHSISETVREIIVMHIAKNPVESVELPGITLAGWMSHRNRLHNGGVPQSGQCDFCDQVFERGIP